MKKSAVLLRLSILGAAANADDVGLRHRLGLNDKTPTDWDGFVTVSPGRVTAISGWHFGGAIPPTEPIAGPLPPVRLSGRAAPTIPGWPPAMPIRMPPLATTAF
jgi:hypothetical protein